MTVLTFARPKQLWSVSALADEFGMAWRTVKKRMEGVPADGALDTGHPGWRVSTAVPHLLGSAMSEGDGFDPDRLPPGDRLSYYRGEAEKLRIEQTRGDLLSRIEVERELARLVEIVGRSYDVLPDLLEREGAMDAKGLVRLEKILDGYREDLYQALNAEDDDGADRAAG